MHRTQIMLDPAEHRAARRRAAELDVSLAEYIRRLVRDDLHGPHTTSDVAALFDLGDSGGSDIAVSKDAYLGEALGASRPRAGAMSAKGPGRAGDEAPRAQRSGRDRPGSDRTGR
jgi:hypothetical protein